MLILVNEYLEKLVVTQDPAKLYYSTTCYIIRKIVQVSRNKFNKFYFKKIKKILTTKFLKKDFASE